MNVTTVPTPSAPGAGEVLFQVKGSSVDPYVIDGVEGPHTKGIIGGDTSGVVVAVGSGADCAHLSVGAEVWVQTKGAYAEVWEILLSVCANFMCVCVCVCVCVRILV